MPWLMDNASRLLARRKLGAGEGADCRRDIPSLKGRYPMNTPSEPLPEQGHECDEACEATGFGMALILPEFKPTGANVHIVACQQHPKCIVIEESGSHYERRGR